MNVVVQATRYLKSLTGLLPNGSTAASFMEEVQTMHRVQVLCKDDALTFDNFREMMRCDCNGYWKNIGCSHVYALAYWCVGAAIGLKLSCNCVASASRYDMGLLDLYKCCKVMAPNAKPGRKRKKKPSLVPQPESPLREQRSAEQVKH